MPPPYRRALARALALTLAVATLTLAGPTAPARADDIPKAPGHRLVKGYEGAPAAASPVPGQAPPLGRSVVGGATRIDVRPDGSGCDTVWESAVRSPSTVPKLSTANGLLYFYEKEPNALGVDAWYLTAVDFRTGERRWRTLTGTGPAYDNNWAPITIGPDGTAYAGVFNGIVAVRDTA